MTPTPPKALKRLFIFHHPVAIQFGVLAKESIDHIANLCPIMAERWEIDPAKTKIASSNVRTTVVAVEHFAKGLHVDQNVSPNECYSQFYSKRDICYVEPAIEILSELADMYETIILVTHFRMAMVLPAKFGKHVLGMKDIPFRKYSPGQGIVIDYERKEFEIL